MTMAKPPHKQDYLAQGYSMVPPGCMASVTTYLEMTRRPESVARLGDMAEFDISDLETSSSGTSGSGKSGSGDIAFQRLSGTHVSQYRAIFAKVGAPWLWFSRLAMPVAELSRLLDNPDVLAFAALKDGNAVGMLEVDFRQEGEAELAFFGLVPDAVGTGLGRPLMEAALKLAWSRPISRVMVHTCTLDHPNALAFYQRAGFHACKRAIEVAQDPRLTGLLPRDCAPHVPLIEP